MTEHTNDPTPIQQDTLVNIVVHLYDTPLAVDRLGDWSPDRSDRAKVRPFVSIRLTPDLTLLCDDPDRLDRLAYCLVDTADTLRALLGSQRAARQPGLVNHQAPA